MQVNIEIMRAFAAAWPDGAIVQEALAQIPARAPARNGKALNNLKATLPPADSALAAPVFKDPCLFDFLGTAGPRREHEVEQALVDHIQRFLVEYALRDLRKPIRVAGRETTLVEKLPQELRGSLPTVEEIEAELAPACRPARPKRRKR